MVELVLLFWFERHGRFGLCLLLCTKFLVAGFPAVGDLGQELTDVFDFFFGPGVMCALSAFRLWGWDFFIFNSGPAWQSNTETLGAPVVSTISLRKIVSDSFKAVRTILLFVARYICVNRPISVRSSGRLVGDPHWASVPLLFNPRNLFEVLHLMLSGRFVKMVVGASASPNPVFVSTHVCIC
jgi:hypothetical protein